MPTDSELIEAALELRNHAWLERFRKATGNNGYNELSPAACNDIAGYVDRFIDKVLAQRADDGELVTEAKLNALGYEDQDYCRGSKAFALPFGVYVYGKATSGPKCWDYYLFCGGEKVKDDPTMRDVRNLLSALGLNQEGGQR
ncbi:MAG: hypothetical protein U0872_15335 [Planctomycetaceae bacterium]